MSMFYRACWTEDDGIYSCRHEHESVREPLGCLVPDGRSFIRACESGVFRSLDEAELICFLAVLRDMPLEVARMGHRRNARRLDRTRLRASPSL